MKKIFVNAYLNNNFGDDLLIYILTKKYPEFEFYVMPLQALEKDFINSSNLNVIQKDQRVLKKILNRFLVFMKFPRLDFLLLNKNEFDLNILLGGSIFIERKRHWKRIFNEEKYLRKKIGKSIIMGCNFGPYYSSRYYKMHKKEFSKYEFVSFREEYSYKQFKNLKNIAFGLDLAFSSGFDIGERQEENYCFFSVIDCSKRAELAKYERVYLEYVSNIINVLGKEKKIILASLCDNEGDYEAIQKILPMIDTYIRHHVQVYRHHKVEETLRMIRNAGFIVGTRFHSIVLSLKWEIPFIPVIYSRKTKNMLEDIGYDGLTIEITRLHINKDINLKEIKPFILKKELIGTAEKHFSYLDSFK